jgi:hypothetical protein
MFALKVRQVPVLTEKDSFSYRIIIRHALYKIYNNRYILSNFMYDYIVLNELIKHRNNFTLPYIR